MNALAKEIYKPVVLPPFLEAIRIFCQDNPIVSFNAPPDLQSEFHKAIGELVEPTAWLKNIYRAQLFPNRPMIAYLKNIHPGDMFLAFVLDKKLGGLTIASKVEKIWKVNDLPPDWRVVIHETKTYRRYFGDGGLWTGCIVAMTRINCLKREMCWSDPEARIFMEKAKKYGIALT
jgi:hypothetical protein